MAYTYIACQKDFVCPMEGWAKESILFHSLTLTVTVSTLRSYTSPHTKYSKKFSPTNHSFHSRRRSVVRPFSFSSVLHIEHECRSSLHTEKKARMLYHTRRSYACECRRSYNSVLASAPKSRRFTAGWLRRSSIRSSPSKSGPKGLKMTRLPDPRSTSSVPLW